MEGAAAYFTGQWTVDRHIADIDSGWTGRFEGWARFSPVPGGLDYLERGRLRLGGLVDTHAWRRYRWVFPHPHRVEVYFEDGSFFHSFDPGLQRAEATPYHDPDLYEVTYEFETRERWRSEWRVEGPRKDYRLVTRYWREG
ncbi:MAG: trigger factor [Alphaproteobacteria bacterium]|nr:MAG: trigger factor [Alphaproteobacteria bacterium]